MTSRRRSSSVTRSRCSARAACCSSTPTRSSCCRTRPTNWCRASSVPIAATAACEFFHASGLPLHDVRSVAEGDVDTLALGPQEWALVIKDGKPFAWINADGVDVHRKGSSLLRQHRRWRILLPARRHASVGAGRRVVLTDGTRGGGRRRRSTARRRAGRRRDELLDKQRRSAGGGVPVRYLFTHLDDLWTSR